MKQADFALALFDPDALPPSGVKAVCGRVESRFNIYRNNVIVSLSSALAQTFPVTQQLVGEEFFLFMARCYVRLSPPRSPLLFLYGESFPDFIKSFEAAQSVAYLADVARLEYLWLQSWHAKDESSLPLEALSQIKDQELDQLTFVFHPAARFFRSPWPVASLWRAHRFKSVPLPDQWDEEAVLVTRPQLQVEVHALSCDVFMFVDLLCQGRVLGEAADQVFDLYDGFNLPQALGILFSSGAVMALNRGES